MSELPLVTIAIPTYNRLDYLQRSLSSALTQTHQSIEVVVSDNASSDGTQAFMQQVYDSRVRYVRHPNNLGMVENWNACLRHSKGEFFLLLSDDDLLAPTAIESLLAAYLKIPNSSFVYGFVSPISDHPKIKKPRFATPKPFELPDEIIQGFLLWGRPTFACSILFRLTSETAKFRYDSSLGLLFDADYWMNHIWHQKQPICYTTELVGHYRLHPTNESFIRGVDAWRDETLIILDRYMQQKQYPIDLKSFDQAVRFHALSRAISSYSIPKWQRSFQVFQLGLKYRPPLALLLRLLVRCFR